MPYSILHDRVSKRVALVGNNFILFRNKLINNYLQNSTINHLLFEQKNRRLKIDSFLNIRF